MTLKAYIESALSGAKHLRSEPEGPLYAGTMEWGQAKYLQALGILGERKQVPTFDIDPEREYWGFANTPTSVYPVDVERGKYYADRMDDLARKRGRQRYPEGRGFPGRPHVSGIKLSVTPEEVLEEFPYPSGC